MTEETIELRYQTELLHNETMARSTMPEHHAKFMEQVDRVAAILGLITWIDGGECEVAPNHYQAALALVRNSMNIWKGVLGGVGDELSRANVTKAYNLGLDHGGLDANILRHIATGDEAQDLIELVYQTYDGELTKSRKGRYIWKPAA